MLKLDGQFIFFLIVTAFDHTGDLFVIRPGDGEEFVYSPVGVNATIHCAVNNTNLGWAIHVDDNYQLAFGNPVQIPDLDSRGIFQNEQSTSLDGVRSSSVIVFGSRQENNNIRICCLTNQNGLKENCTTLLLYGKVNTKS